MKKLISLLILAISLIIGITSCEKDEITIESNQIPIELNAEEVTEIPSDDGGVSIAIDSFDVIGNSIQNRSSWSYLVGWTFTSPSGWNNLGYIPRSYLEDYDVQAVISTSNYTGAIITHGWSPFRWITGYYAYANTNTTLLLTLEDLLSTENRGYFHAYSWTNNTTYHVEFHVRPRGGVDDYPYIGQSACHINNGCDADDWNFCKDNCTSWIAWKVNQAQGVTDLGLGAYNYPFYNQMTSPALSHAKNWDTRLASIGFPVNDTPQNECIAQWEGNSANGYYGHVAWVISTSSDGTITVSEYNYSPSCEYNTRQISPSSSAYPDNFIHVL